MNFELGHYLTLHCTVDVMVSDRLRCGKSTAAKCKRLSLVEISRHRSQSQKLALILKGPIAFIYVDLRIPATVLGLLRDDSEAGHISILLARKNTVPIGSGNLMTGRIVLFKPHESSALSQLFHALSFCLELNDACFLLTQRRLSLQSKQRFF